ncbi:hypothetical protein GT370_13080 [Acidocella sp. MX-AZ03]|uniref:hypothetical protein n=1 Tax=Acidocella sp. MX-AZ03 TaxID=2697363 RepID=UPI0022DE8F5E|nr:hypothetical protein [Acidocella sp. MX-AZ03]WBO58167.1 hypothetical protein GT370_13080 [Acidocella sp. MX-AZ03]
MGFAIRALLFVACNEFFGELLFGRDVGVGDIEGKTQRRIYPLISAKISFRRAVLSARSWAPQVPAKAAIAVLTMAIKSGEERAAFAIPSSWSKIYGSAMITGLFVSTRRRAGTISQKLSDPLK